MTEETCPRSDMDRAIEIVNRTMWTYFGLLIGMILMGTISFCMAIYKVSRSHAEREALKSELFSRLDPSYMERIETHKNFLRGYKLFEIRQSLTMSYFPGLVYLTVCFAFSYFALV